MPRIVESLRAGTLSVWEALDQPRCWLCDVDHQSVLGVCRSVDLRFRLAVKRDCDGRSDPIQFCRVWSPTFLRQCLQGICHEANQS
jgi:hypothetical protein